MTFGNGASRSCYSGAGAGGAFVLAGLAKIAEFLHRKLHYKWAGLRRPRLQVDIDVCRWRNSYIHRRPRRCPGRLAPSKRSSRPAAVIRSVTFLLLSFDGSTLGASRSFERWQRRVRRGAIADRIFERSARLQDLLPALARDPFQERLRFLGCLLESSTPPPEMLTNAPGSWFLK